MFARILAVLGAALLFSLPVQAYSTTPVQEFRTYVLRQAQLGGLPFDTDVFVQVVRVELATSRPNYQRDYALTRELVEEMVYQSQLRGLDLDVMLAIGWQESRFRTWATSPGGEFCGPFQQGARYSMDPPLRSIRVGGPSCRRNEACQEECARLQQNPWYAVNRLVSYLELVDRVTNGRHREQVCRYQGGARGACGEAARAYASRHVAYRQQLTSLYRKHYAAQVLNYTVDRVMGRARYSKAWWRA